MILSAYLVGGDDADAHGSAAAGAGYDFGDAASMAAEFAPVLGGAPAGQRARSMRTRAPDRHGAAAALPPHAQRPRRPTDRRIRVCAVGFLGGARRTVVSLVCWRRAHPAVFFRRGSSKWNRYSQVCGGKNLGLQLWLLTT